MKYTICSLISLNCRGLPFPAVLFYALLSSQLIHPFRLETDAGDVSGVDLFVKAKRRFHAIMELARETADEARQLHAPCVPVISAVERVRGSSHLRSVTVGDDLNGFIAVHVDGDLLQLAVCVMSMMFHVVAPFQFVFPQSDASGCALR